MQVRPPSLKEVAFTVGEDGTFPSPEVFEAMPSLERVCCTIAYHEDNASLVRSVLPALRGGVAFQCLREFRLDYHRIEDADLAALLDALSEAACAPHLECLKLQECNIGGQGIGKLAEHLAQDKFPALKHLNVGKCVTIADTGIAALCDGLLCAPRTRLVSLDLSYTQMDHVGMAKLGAVIQAGRLTLLETLHLSRNVNLTDKAVFVLAEAIQQAKNALSHLRTLMMDRLEAVTGVGVEVLLTTVFHNCPQIELIDMSLPIFRGERADNASLQALVSTLGWKGKVKL